MLATSIVVAATDPTPNPFAALKTGERVTEGVILKNENDTLTVRADDGKEFSAKTADVYRYRDGASVPDDRELRVGDRGRLIGTSDGTLVAFQDYHLVLGDVVTYGWIRAVTPKELTLETVAYKKLPLFVDAATPYFSAPAQPLLDYTPPVDTAVRVHAVVNPRTHELYAYARDTYIRLATADEMTAARTQALADETAITIRAAEELKDIVSDTPYRTAIGFVKKAGIVGGYADGTFQPTKTVNRAEFTKIVIGARFTDAVAELSTAADRATRLACFTDVDPSAWYAPYVCVAKEKGVLGGYADGTFHPAQAVNLAEALKIIAGAYGWTLQSSGKEAAWYASAQQTAKQLSVLPTDFAAIGAPLTRGQLAELVMRAERQRRGDLLEYLQVLSTPAANTMTGVESGK